MKTSKQITIHLNYRQFELIIKALHEHIDSLLDDIHDGGEHNLCSDYNLLGKFETTFAKLFWQESGSIRLTQLQSSQIDYILDYFIDQESEPSGEITGEDCIELQNVKKDLPVRSYYH